MSEKFTPGPWAINRDGRFITSIGPISAEDYAGESWLKVSEDNAHLIAAAPDLLTVSEHAIQWLQGDKWRFDEDPTKRESWEIMMRALKNAVAKARGQS